MAQPSPRSPRWLTIVSLVLVAVFVFGMVAVTQATLEGNSNRAPNAAFSPNNLVVVRIGDGAAALSSNATATFLDEYTTAAGQAAPVQSIALPTAVNGLNRRLTLSGTATSEGALNRSSNGQYLTLGGYDAVLGQANVPNTSPATVNRVVGRVDSAGVADTTTVLNAAYSFTNIRSAVTDDGTRFWTGGGAGTLGPNEVGGTHYVTLGSTGASTRISNVPANTRVTGIFGGQLYTSSSSFTGGTFAGVNQVGTGLPTTAGQTTTRLPGVSANLNAYAYVFLDRTAAISGADTLYVADQNTAEGIVKYSFNGTTWAVRGSTGTTLANNRGVTGLTGVISGTQVVLYATIGTGAGNTLERFVDTAAREVNIAGSFTVLATASANTVFRGVAFAPVAPIVPTAVPTVIPTAVPTVIPTVIVTPTMVMPTTTVTPTMVMPTATAVPPCLTYNVALDGSQEVPPASTKASGSGTVRIDTVNNTISYNITFSGLIGTETMAHIHGFAPRGSNAGVKITLPLGSPKIGTASYNEADEASYLGGLAYVNIHSTTFTGGEIRGQIDGTSSPLGCDPTPTAIVPTTTVTPTMVMPTTTTTVVVPTTTVAVPTTTTTVVVPTTTVTAIPTTRKVYLPLILKSAAQ